MTKDFYRHDFVQLCAVFPSFYPIQKEGHYHLLIPGRKAQLCCLGVFIADSLMYLTSSAPRLWGLVLSNTW